MKTYDKNGRELTFGEIAEVTEVYFTEVERAILGCEENHWIFLDGEWIPAPNDDPTL